jgi:hypothetical protein
MFATIDIAREVTAAAPRFHFASRTGEVPFVATIILMEESGEELVWSLVPEGFTPCHSYSVGKGDEAAVQSLARVDEVHPIGDMPSSDTHHQRSLAESAAAERATLTPLTTLTYGQVPSGFRQRHPVGELAPVLIPGRKYRLLVIGRNDAGQFTFVP